MESDQHRSADPAAGDGSALAPQSSNLPCYCCRINVVFAVEVGVIYLSCAVPLDAGDRADITLSVAVDAPGIASGLRRCLHESATTAV